MNESSNLPAIQALLGEYLDFDFTDQLAGPRRKRDGNYYATYLGVLKPEYAPLAPDRRALVIKEIMPAQAEHYRKISSVWSPYLETVYGVLPVGDFFIALNEFIPKPSSLYYPDRKLFEEHSLSLEDYISHFGCLSEPEALIFMVQLCEGLEALKKFRIVHGDISPQNILLTDRFPKTDCPYPKIKGLHQTAAVKIIDFDIAREQHRSEHQVTAVEGTRLYAAPEILDYQPPTDRVDIYSLGCILSYMITGKSPKQFTSKQFWKSCSPRVRNIIRKCTLNYSKRYRSITLLKQELQTAIEILCPRNLLRMIPGVRSGRFKDIRKTITICNFFVLFLACAISLKDTWVEMTATCLIPIFGFDIFRLGDRSYTYTVLRDKHPWIRSIARCVLGILLPYALFTLF